MKRFFICVFVFVAGTFYAHSQDIIIFKNGNVIEAKVLEVSSSAIRYKRFDNLDGSTVVTPANNVLSIRYENEMANTMDIIIFKNGDIIDAKVTEISPSAIRYKRSDNLDGPVIVTPANNVLSIRYENGIVQTITTEPAVRNETAAPATSKSSGIDSQKTHFAISADPSGFALFGPSIAAEITKGKFNTQINLRFPSLGLASSGGFGMGVSLNYFHHTQLGGFYIGGLLDYSTEEKNIGDWKRDWVDGYYAGGGYSDGINWIGDYYFVDGQWGDRYWVISKQRVHYATLALNAGYKFILSSGMYFRVGGYLGFQFSKYDSNFLARPELSFGYYF